MLPNEEEIVRNGRLVQKRQVKAAQLRFFTLNQRRKTETEQRPAGQQNIAARRHQATLSAICRIRGSPSVLVIFPKFGLVMPVTGLARWVALRVERLEAVFDLAGLAEERQPPTLGQRMSMLAKPGPNRTFRPSVP